MARKKIAHSRKEEILGILLMALALLIFISLVSFDPQEQPGNINHGSTHNSLGVAGVYISHFLIHYCIGYPSFVFPLIIFVVGFNLLFKNPFIKSLRTMGYLLAFALYTSVILAIPEVTSAGDSTIGFSLSGLVGGIIAKSLFGFMGIAGSVVILLSLIMITFIGATKISLSQFLTNISEEAAYLYERVRDSIKDLRERKKVKPKRPPKNLAKDFDWDADETSSPINEVELADEANTEFNSSKIPIKQMQLSMDDELASESGNKKGKAAEVPKGLYAPPAIELLNAPNAEAPSFSEDELNLNAQILEDRLLEFNVQGKVTEINPGPVITRYDVEPAAGVKISRIVGLADDLALAMRAKRIRIVAPVPGKGAVGIEIPNRDQATVYLREILNTKAFRDSESPLTIALGKSISGEPFVTTLEKMPHLLIAGATGSGKSICLNSIIASILYKAHPTQVQFVMVDPKRLELTVYNDLRHHHLTYKEDLNEEVVTSADNAISVLKSLIVLMNRRYEILARAGVRNIADYNKKLQDGRLQHLEHEEPYESLPYIVVIIDELADLMLTSAREIEEPIARLAQMARAIGIHLIVATQRPSVNVITGVIKANFPARIAFQVASKTDSRTILDLNGAEKLLGRGDMLFIPQGSPEPRRVHGAFVSIEEIEGIIGHIRRQPKYPKQTLPVEQEVIPGMRGEPGGLNDVGQRDALFGSALKLIVRHQQGSISLIQRRLSIGYARAARLIDQLEAAGVVGPYDGSKAREVLIDEEELEQMDLG